MKKTPLFLIYFLIFSFSYSQTTCPAGEIPDCNGNCAPSTWVGDQYCDDGAYAHNGVFIFFNCEEFECDAGDCDCDGEPEIPSFCDSGDCDLLTFVVNTANIEVGPNGMYAGGGFFDSATAVPLYENDPVSNDGFYVGSVYVNTGQSGYFIYLNSPESSTDYSSKENLTGQSCAYGEFDDRYLPPVDGDIVLEHCFGSCEEDGSCPGSGGNDDGDGDGSSCENAIPITAGTYYVDGIDGESEPLQCHEGNQAPPNGNMEWYSYTPSENYTVTVESYNSQVDETRFQVYGGSCDNLYCVGGDDDSGVSSYSSDTFDVVAGNTYYIAWDDAQTSWEDFEFTLTEFEIPDNCTWTLNMYDSYGDGWEDFWGNNLYVQIWITDTTGNSYSIASGSFDDGYSESETFEVPIGSTVSTLWIGAAGGGSESSYEIVDSNGTVVAAASEAEVEGIVVNSDCSGLTDGGSEAPGCGDLYVYDYESGFSGGTNFANNYTSPNPNHLVFTTTAGDQDNDGITDEITVTLGGSTENNYDWLYITDGAGNLIYGPVSGEHSGSYTSTDGTINAYIAADLTIQQGPVTFDITCSGLSVSENEISDLRIYPNPVDTDYITIVSSLVGDKFIEMFDINGRRVLSTSISGNTLDISSLESGFYMTRVTIDGKSSTSKIIIN
jgi:hypothetical protein